MGVFDSIKEPMKPPKVSQFSIQVVVQCGCGAPEPIMVHFIPGAEQLMGVCPRCQASFRLARFEYDMQSQGNVRIAVMTIPPRIVKPQGLVVPVAGN